ncbi:MAG: response regulator, partial [Woeseiaceae bacterium]|nr:response regulator [Woeseiaceae bacterium]
MSLRVMIIDGQAEFRSLLMHHVTTIWNDAIISAYDPVAAGHLPDEFSGAGNDLVLVGSEQGDRDPLDTLRAFRCVQGFPPIVYFGKGSSDERQEARRLGIDGYFARDKVRNAALSVR